jgi:transketolase
MTDTTSQTAQTAQTSQAGGGLAERAAEGTALPKTGTTMENVFSGDEAKKAPAAAGNVVGSTLAALADEGHDIVVVSADMGGAVGELRSRHPDRYFDFGIAETNTMSVAAGLAASGITSFVLAMGPFGILKCAEQIRTDLASTHMPVRIIARSSGLAMGFFGTSHHAVEDIAIARSITGMTITAPSDNHAVEGLIRSTLDHPGPVYIRMSAPSLPGAEAVVYPDLPTFERGRFRTVRAGSDLTVIAVGNMVQASLVAAEALAAEGISLNVIDAVYIKPLDEEAIAGAAEATGRILTVEEHNEVGGLGSAVAEVIARRRLPAAIDIFALPDEDLKVALPGVLLPHYNLTPSGIADRARKLLEA